MSKHSAGEIVGQTILEGETHFKMLVHPGQIIMWTANLEGVLEFISPSWTEFTGRPVAEDLGHGWTAAVHPDDLHPCLNNIASAISARRAFRCTFRLRGADGQYRYVANEVSPRFLANGELGGLIGQCFDITAQHEGELAMRESETQFMNLLKSVNLNAIMLNLAGEITFCNETLLNLLGQPASAVEGQNFIDSFLTPDSANKVRGFYLNRSQWSDFPDHFQTELVTRMHGVRIIHWHATLLKDFACHTKNVALLGEDITDRRRRADRLNIAARSAINETKDWRKLRRLEDKMKLTAEAFDKSHEGMILTDAENRIISVNHAFTELTGYTAEEAIGQNPRLLQSGLYDKEFYQNMWESLHTDGFWHDEIWNKRKDGSVYPEDLGISVIRNEQGEITSYSAIFYNIAERKEIEEKMDRLAHYDALTGLPNRALLEDRLEQAIARAERNQCQLALMFLDIDHFKEVNDTLGHAMGDELLKAIAARLKENLRNLDTVARLGGDEFVLIVNDISRLDIAEQVAQKILVSLSRTYDLNGIEVNVTPSIGISLYPDDHFDPAHLMDKADKAMYQVKNSGRGSYIFFNPACN